jgi:hypothetical protein
MKPSPNPLQDASRREAAAIVATRVLALFQRLPMLCGFALRRDLQVTEVSVCTWPGQTAGEDLYEELMQTLADLAEERADALQLMCGRTFARAFHSWRAGT